MKLDLQLPIVCKEIGLLTTVIRMVSVSLHYLRNSQPSIKPGGSWSFSQQHVGCVCPEPMNGVNVLTTDS